LNILRSKNIFLSSIVVAVHAGLRVVQ